MRIAARRLVAPVLVLGLVATMIPGAAMAKAPDFSDIFEKNKDAVVNIATTQKVDASAGGIPSEMLEQLPPGHPLKRFFKRYGGGDGGDNGSPKRERSSLGSGFIISEDGYVLTNAHVVAKADEIVVKLHDNRQFDAKVVGMDKPTDVGLLKIDATNLPTVKIGSSDKLEVGQWLFAIGSPFGLEYTATQGIVSALERSLPNDSYTPFVQTDVAVNPGSSGGPLFNGKGEVIGINSQIFSRSGGYMGLSFAVPINSAMDVVEQLKENGKVARGYLGVSIQPVDRGLAKSFGLDKPVGALVADVMPDTPAEKGGLKAGDVILEFNGEKIVDAADLPVIVGTSAIGENAMVQIVRDGERRTLEVPVGSRTEYAEKSGESEATGGGAAADLNIAVRELSEQERKKFGLDDRGLLVGNVAPGPIAQAGIQAGDVLLRFGDRSLTSVDQLRQAVKEAPRGEPIAVRVKRDDRSMFVTVTLPEK